MDYLAKHIWSHTVSNWTAVSSGHPWFHRKSVEIFSELSFQVNMSYNDGIKYHNICIEKHKGVEKTWWITTPLISVRFNNLHASNCGSHTARLSNNQLVWWMLGCWFFFFHCQLSTWSLCRCPTAKGTTRRELKWFGKTTEEKKNLKLKPKNRPLVKWLPVTYILSSQFRADDQSLADTSWAYALGIYLLYCWTSIAVNEMWGKVKSCVFSVDIASRLSTSPVSTVLSERDSCLQKLTADLCLFWSRLSLSARPPLHTRRVGVGRRGGVVTDMAGRHGRQAGRKAGF